MKTTRFLAPLVALGLLAATAHAADLTPTDKQFLAGYGQVQTALAADDLAKAKTAASALPDGAGADVAKAADLAAARTGFETLSTRAITLAKGQPGFRVINCPMLKKDWVQTDAKIANPYAGKSMLTCGVEKK